MKVNAADSLIIADNKAAELAEVLGHSVKFNGNTEMVKGILGRRVAIHVNYTIRFMPDEFGKESTYGRKFFNDIREHGFKVAMQVIDWNSREIVHHITMVFGDDAK